MERPSWAPDDVDLDRPSVARVYDYYLGGSHNFAADRAFAEQVLQVMPHIAEISRGNRAFLRRVVRFLCAQGIRQFIDLGSGIPTVGNVHEVAAEAGVRAKVVYVDHDPIAVAHSRKILLDNPDTVVVDADLRRPEGVLANPAVRGFIDFREPVALLMVAVLHFVPDGDHPGDIVAGYAAATVPGSYVALSHAGFNRERSTGEDEAVDLYRRSPTPLILRDAGHVRELLGDLTILEPGVVPPGLWRPDSDEPLPPDDPRLLGSAAVARKD